MKKLIINTSFGTPMYEAFTTLFKGIAEVVIFENNRKNSLPIPEQAFFFAAEGSINQNEAYWKTKESKESVFFGTIQKGYIKIAHEWFFTAFVCIKTEGKVYGAFTQGVIVPCLTDTIMEKQESVREEVLEKQYPNFEKTGLFSRLKTDITEEEWLKKALQEVISAIFTKNL